VLPSVTEVVVISLLSPTFFVQCNRDDSQQDGFVNLSDILLTPPYSSLFLRGAGLSRKVIPLQKSNDKKKSDELWDRTGASTSLGV
jgi:hypothetical protein